MKDKKNYYQKYRNYFFCEIVLLIGWLINFVLFTRFYEESVFYVDKQAKFIIQLLFMMNYYLEDMLKYLFVSFLLMTLNLLLILVLYIKNKQSVIDQKKMMYSIIVFLIVIGINAIALLNTIVWPLFLLVFILSFTVVYIIYVIASHLYEERDESYDEGEVVKTEGAFQTKEEAERYIKAFLTHWTDDFEKKGYRLVSNVEQHQKNEWYVEFIVRTIKPG